MEALAASPKGGVRAHHLGHSQARAQSSAKGPKRAVRYTRHGGKNQVILQDKIAESHAASVGTDALTSGLVDAIIDMAQRLKLRVIAEGIETREQAEYLREKGVDYGQGWYFSRGMNAVEFMNFVSLFNNGSV